MSGGSSQYLQQGLLNVLGGTAFPFAGANAYLALFTTLPGADGTGGVEATGGSYSRLAVPCDTTHWPAATGGGPASITNGVTLTMFTASGSVSAGANIVGWGLFDALTSGNLLFWGPVATPAPVASTQTPTFPASSLVVTVK